MMKIAQQKQEVTEKAVKQGENEINRISEVLQKLQNEILKDLSDGIHMVKDARERDFTSLERWFYFINKRKFTLCIRKKYMY